MSQNGKFELLIQNTNNMLNDELWMYEIILQCCSCSFCELEINVCLYHKYDGKFSTVIQNQIYWNKYYLFKRSFNSKN